MVDTQAATPTPWKLVTHERPDTDAWCCLWAAIRFLVPEDAEWTITFVRSGERLPEEECEGFHVHHMDTGLGSLDQHGKGLARGSSFGLFADRYLKRDPAIEPIRELCDATDNIEEVPRTSIHYVFKGLPHYLRGKDPGTGWKEVNWEQVRLRVFEILDVVYDQAVIRLDSQKKFDEKFKIYALENGVKVAPLPYTPSLREAAFERGADVVVWTQNIRGQKGFYVGIQVHRKSRVALAQLAASIRGAEAGKRNLVFRGNLSACGTMKEIPGWFLHDSQKFVCSGTLSHPLEPHEFTRLKWGDLIALVNQSLGKLKLVD